MRHSVSRRALYAPVLVLTLLLSAAPVSRVHAANSAGGIRIAPAALRLELDKNAAQASIAMNITNTYSVPVQIHLAVERSASNLGGSVDPVTLVSLSAADVTIAGGQTMAETLTLHDNPALSPGSQVVDLMVAQKGTATVGVGVQPAVRLPVTLIKDDGAVRSVAVTRIGGSSFSLQVPSTVSLTIHNTGNVVAIPRGIVSIRDPRGVVIAQGVINISSAAIMPGKVLATSVPITSTGKALVPGLYSITADYGLGGDSPTQMAIKHYLFIGIWHIAALLAVLALIVALSRNTKRWLHAARTKRQKVKSPPKPPAKRRILIGRNA